MRSISSAIFILIIAITSIPLGSCSASRNTAKAESGTGVSSLDARYTSLIESYSPWTDVRVPVNVSMQKPMKLSIGGTLTMVRGKAVHISLRFLGMEVASLMVTPDSVMATYRMDKIYLQEPLHQLLGRFPATISDLQDLLSGRTFTLGDPNRADIRLISNPDGGYAIIPPPPVKGAPADSYVFTVDSSNSLKSLTVNPGQGRQPVICTYLPATITPCGMFSPRFSILANIGRTTVDASVELSLGKAKWNRGEAPSWKIPKGYKRVDGQTLIKRIPSL